MRDTAKFSAVKTVWAKVRPKRCMSVQTTPLTPRTSDPALTTGCGGEWS